jgi:hypothetical protein
MSYRLLVLPESDRMPIEVVRKLRELAEGGATLVGPRPRQDPGLKHHPQCDADVQAEAAAIWGDCDGNVVKQHACGRGRVLWNVPLRDILLADGVSPDFEYVVPADSAASLDFIHRATAEHEIYFVVNRQNRAVALECLFRVTDRRPEIWDPVTGEMRLAAAFRSEAGRTVVPLEFAAHQSLFVVFPARSRAANVAGGATRNFSDYTTVAELSGPWTVRFDPRWGGPETVEFAALEDWSRRPEDGIRHYSGKATYVKEFDLPPTATDRCFLELGVVKNIAEVRLNGKSLGIVWTAPWRVELTSALKPGGNRIEVDVVNLWTNRLVGDAGKPVAERLTWTNIETDPQTPLQPSGLLGPVKLQVLRG